jgi:hypothetical protein
MEILTILKIVDIAGVSIGIVWFLLWLFVFQKEITFFRHMQPKRLWVFLRELGLCFGSKAFGKVSVGMLFGEGLAFSGAEVSGRLISRYAIVGGASELSFGSYFHAKAAIIAFIILIAMMAAEIGWAIYKNPRLISDKITFFKLCLESYVVFGIVGMITGFYL